MKIKYIYICMYLPISLLVSRCPDAAAGGEQSVQCTALIIIPLIIELLPPLTFTFTYSLGVD